MFVIVSLLIKLSQKKPSYIIWCTKFITSVNFCINKPLSNINYKDNVLIVVNGNNSFKL